MSLSAVRRARDRPECFRVARRPWSRGLVGAACARQVQTGLDGPREPEGSRGGGCGRTGEQRELGGARATGDAVGREGLRIVGSRPEAALRRLAGCLVPGDRNLEKVLLLIKRGDVIRETLFSNIYTDLAV